MRTCHEENHNHYAEFMQNYVPAIAGVKHWSAVRQIEPLGSCITYSDEAFLLLCYECYQRKWARECNIDLGLDAGDEISAQVSDPFFTRSIVLADWSSTTRKINIVYFYIHALTHPSDL
jgi:hypothetical protein